MSKILLIILALFVLAGGVYIITDTGAEAPREGGPDTSSVTGSNGATADLSGKGLKAIPSYIFNQTNLEKLDVSDNALTGAIQAEIRHLTNLRILDASNNEMTGVPAEIGQLKKLEILDLSNNKLTGLPHELGNLENLKTLNLSGNNYSTQDLDYIRSKLPPTVTIIVD